MTWWVTPVSNLLQNLLISTAVGTIVFLVVFVLKPLTWRVFSKTWHYYMGIVLVFFFLGGVAVVNMLAPFTALVVFHVAAKSAVEFLEQYNITTLSKL